MIARSNPAWMLLVVSPNLNNPTPSLFVHVSLLVLCSLLMGCEGKSLVDTNPVFSDVPPRRSLTNKSSVADNRTVDADGDVKVVSHVSKDKDALTGNTVIAEVNGRPVFVDDLVASIRLAVEADDKLSSTERQAILHAQIKNRLAGYLDQEIVLNALKQTIPEDRQGMIKESLEEPFGEVVADIKQKNNVETDDQLNELLAQQGMSIDLLRESFVRIQMVQGYLSTVATFEEEVDRIDMLEYYNSHRDEFTSEERVRCHEIVIQFRNHGGREGAEKEMAEVVRKLQQGADFAEVATAHSDALSAEKRGDMGWLHRGSLADKQLEERLFEVGAGQTTRIFIRDDRFEVYHVVAHEQASTSPLSDVQQQIKSTILQERKVAARELALKELREKAIVVTMYDDDPDFSLN